MQKLPLFRVYHVAIRFTNLLHGSVIYGITIWYFNQWPIIKRHPDVHRDAFLKTLLDLIAASALSGRGV